MRRMLSIAALASAALVSVALAAGDAKPARVVMMGDSVTLSKAAPDGEKLPQVTEKALNAASWGKVAWTVVNSGVGSETAEGGLRRVKAVLDANAPNIVTLEYGLNDVGRKDPKWFIDQVTMLVDAAEKHPSKPQVVLLTATPLDNKRHFYAKDPGFWPGGPDQYMDRQLNGAVRRLAAERGLPLIDVHRAFVRAANWQALLSPDGVHPLSAGNKLVGEYVAKALAAWAEAQGSPESKAAQAEKSARAKLDLAKKAMAAKKPGEAKRILAEAMDLCPWLADIAVALDEAELAGK